MAAGGGGRHMCTPCDVFRCPQSSSPTADVIQGQVRGKPISRTPNYVQFRRALAGGAARQGLMPLLPLRAPS